MTGWLGVIQWAAYHSAHSLLELPFVPLYVLISQDDARSVIYSFLAHSGL